jgi:tetratricopeptide (TPR) repeat protein
VTFDRSIECHTLVALRVPKYRAISSFSVDLSQYFCKAGEGTTLNNISQIYYAQGDYTTALTYLTNSLAIHQEIGDKAGEGTTLNNIATIYHAQGDYTIALTLIPVVFYLFYNKLNLY